jgi:hypothetical protein
MWGTFIDVQVRTDNNNNSHSDTKMIAGGSKKIEKLKEEAEE